MFKICALIPAYNEEKSISSVIKKIKKHNIDIAVIDDKSKDRTAYFAEKENVCLLRQSSNEGKGSALRRGFKWALKNDYDYIITIDADSQHNPDEIPFFMNQVFKNASDIVLGSRMHLPKDMPLYRLCINKLFSRIVSRACKQHIPDALCGYRIIKKEVLKELDLDSDRFDIDPEILIKASKKGFKITSVNIETIYSGETSHIEPLRFVYTFIARIIKESKK